MVGSLAPSDVDAYLRDVLTEARRYVADASVGELATVPNTTEILLRSGVTPDRFGWLFAMWEGRPASFFVRWPLIGHVGNRVGEMIATRNRMGLSPF